MNKSLGKRIRDFFAGLQDSGAVLQLFDFLPDVFLYVKDADGRFMKVNQTLVRARGLDSESELLGKTDLDIHPRYWGLRYREEDRAVMRSGKQLVDQVWLVPDVQGRLESFLSSKIPLFNREGLCTGIAGVRRPLHVARSGEYTESLGIDAAVRMITERYAESIEMAALAKVASLSHSQFNRRFRAIYRMSPSAYLQRVRVHEVSRRLVERHQAIGMIALETGFYDQAHLTRTFKKILGVTPKDFRRMNETRPSAKK